MSKQNPKENKEGAYIPKVEKPAEGIVKGGQIPTSKNPPPKKGGK